MVPLIKPLLGMMLQASPATSWPMVRMRGSCWGRSRLLMVCNAEWMWHRMLMGSMPFFQSGAMGPFSSDGDLKRIRTGHRRGRCGTSHGRWGALGGGAMDPHSGIL